MKSLLRLSSACWAVALSIGVGEVQLAALKKRAYQVEIWSVKVTAPLASLVYCTPSKPMRSMSWPSLEVMKSSTAKASSLCSESAEIAQPRDSLATSTAASPCPPGPEGMGSSARSIVSPGWAWRILPA
ncbi:hypothetical protein D9M68_880430 [compost metagenome]